MKKGLTIEELSAEVLRQRAAKKDFVADTQKLSIQPRGEALRLLIDGHGDFAITENAHNQIADRMAIPHRYYHRMLQESPGPPGLERQPLVPGGTRQAHGQDSWTAPPGHTCQTATGRWTTMTSQRRS